MKKKELYRQLVTRYFSGSASVEEVEVFFRLLDQGELDEFLPTEGQRPKTVNIRWYAAAAAIVLLGSAALFWRHTAKPKPATAQIAANQFLNDKAPGTATATLSQSGGQPQTLNSHNNGAQIKKGGTITTPASGEFAVTLSDGTRIWLNSLSRLTVPDDFGKTDRTVNITGEAYVEVAPDPRRPFHVRVGDVDIQVLGTAFNVNAYGDEPYIKTTLIKGSIKLVRSGNSLLLKPGEEASADVGGLKIDTGENADQALAWKNGYFDLEGADIRTIMRQIARWYGVDVRYEGEPTKERFGGQIGRDLNLSELLTGLTKNNLHFRLEGNILTVLN